MYGQVLKERYVLLKVVGKGCYSDVWVAYDCATRGFVAVKKICHLSEEDEEAAKREVEVLHRIAGGPCVCPLLDSFVDQEDSWEPGVFTCMVFPLFGGTLYDMYTRRRLKSETVQSVHAQLGSFLRYLHGEHGLIHGDVKPENLVYHGPNPACERLTRRFAGHSIPDRAEEASRYILEHVLQEEDKNYDDFEVYNSSNEESTSGSDDTGELESARSDGGSGGGSDGGSEWSGGSSEWSGGSSEEDWSHCSGSEESDGGFEEEGSEEESSEAVEPFELFVIDYSNTHALSEDSKFVCTRYYRCPQSILGSPAGFYKDWFAAACTLHELATGAVLVDPGSGKHKDRKQLEMIEVAYPLVQKWIPSDVVVPPIPTEAVVVEGGDGEAAGQEGGEGGGAGAVQPCEGVEGG